MNPSDVISKALNYTREENSKNHAGEFFITGKLSVSCLRRAIREALDATNDDAASLKAIQMHIEGQQLSVSTSIVETTTYGYGNLDTNGFWEYQLPDWYVGNVIEKK